MGGGSGAPPAHTTPISCWLVPPEKPNAELSALVQKLASENGLPAFDVHITIIGDVLGEHCSSEAEAIERLQLLEHSGAVPCRFASIECSYSPRKNTHQYLVEGVREQEENNPLCPTVQHFCPLFPLI